MRECERDHRVVGITAAMNSGTGLNILQKAMPDRYFDVGIAEQQALLFAAGLALQGSRPVAAIYSTFLQRAFDQIVHDVCLQQLPVVLAMDRAGLVGDDGPTHHGAFDIAYLRCLPNITLMAPRDEAMLVHMLHTALQHDGGPVGIRYPRGEAVGVPLPAAPRLLEIGTGEILREGERVAIVGYGTGVGQALGAADLLAEGGLDVTVADARFAKPLDTGLLAQLAAEHDLLVTVEEGVLAGGFGTAVWESLSEGGLTPRILRVGLPDRYVTHGAPKLLHAEVGFTPERDRRADPGRGARPARLARLGVAPPLRVVDLSPGMARVRLDSLLAERGLFPSRSRAAAAVLAGDVHLGPGPPAGGEARPARRRRTSSSTSRAAAVRLARRDQARERARRARASTSPAAARSTSAPRPAGSPTACCSAARRTWSRSTWPTASWRWRCATTRA